MFEQSLVESAAIPTPRRGWTTLASTCAQATFVLALALLPMLRVEILPSLHLEPPVITIGSPDAPRTPPAHRAPGSSTVAANGITEPFRLPHSLHPESGGPTGQPIGDAFPYAGPGDVGPGIDIGIPILGSGFPPLLPPPPKRKADPIILSQGVTKGFLVTAPQPVYPEVARRAGIQGEVVLSAVIGRTGEIERLEVLSGSPWLIRSAVDAVQRWKYRPFLLNGAPTEVQTQITVRFLLSGQ